MGWWIHKSEVQIASCMLEKPEFIHVTKFNMNQINPYNYFFLFFASVNKGIQPLEVNPTGRRQMPLGHKAIDDKSWPFFLFFFFFLEKKLLVMVKKESGDSWAHQNSILLYSQLLRKLTFKKLEIYLALGSICFSRIQGFYDF